MAAELESPPAESTKAGAPVAGVAAEGASFAEVALKLGGKSDDEARRTGAIDRADDQVEELFETRRQTAHSPAHRAVWDRVVPIEEFAPNAPAPSADAERVAEASLAIVRARIARGNLYNDEGRVSEETLAELGAAGYWGLLVDREHGGVGAPFSVVARLLTRMATLDGTVAGLASIHGCIGAVDPVKTFGDPEQRRRFLPRLASGERLSAFALTEPGAGSDLTALRTTARLEGDHYVVDGEKLFISNVVPGRTIGLVCLVGGKPAVLVVDLPDHEDDSFRLNKYGLHALRHLYNRGIVFRGFRVPKENLLAPPRGDGLTIAYHGLNLGRVALCANAAGTMRQMLSGMIPWAHRRVTYGQPIERRELVRRRLGELAALVVGCDALVAWCSDLLDRGYRGEMECIVAKIFGSEAQKHAAIELCMKTHGGRAFLHGHPFGDNVHDFLAPCIYEGEGEMLGMALFKSLVKDHGKRYFEPVGRALAAAGIARPNPLNPRHAAVLARVAGPYLRWRAGRALGGTSLPTLPRLPERLAGHAEFACRELPRMAIAIDNAMQKFQLGLADRQCRMAALSQRVQDLLVVLVTALHAGRASDEVVREAGDLLCQRLRQRLSSDEPTDHYFRQATRLGERIAAGEAAPAASLGLAEVPTWPILQPYAEPADA